MEGWKNIVATVLYWKQKNRKEMEVWNKFFMYNEKQQNKLVWIEIVTCCMQFGVTVIITR